MRLEVTNRAGLAIRAMVALASNGGRLKGVEVARTIGTTQGFVPQVLAPLVRVGWVASDPGPTGGYRAMRNLEGLSVLDVIEAVDGPTDVGRCVVEDAPCGIGDHCALHTAWAAARDKLRSDLAATPLSAARHLTVTAGREAPASTETAEGPRARRGRFEPTDHQFGGPT